MIDLYTGSYFTTFGAPGRIVTSLGNPRSPAFAGLPHYSPLKPKRDHLRLGFEEYVEAYTRDILCRLDPFVVISDLRNLAQGATPIILCYERPPLHRENFCHRKIVGDWLTRTLGLQVAEWSGIRESNPATSGDQSRDQLPQLSLF